MPTQISYQRDAITGRFLPVPAVDRFWAFINKTETCWLWLGRHDKDGYAQFCPDRIACRAARFAYELLRGSIPSTLVVDHLCRNRGCVNPHHLEAVTALENTYRGVGFAAQNKRKTHCKRGHALVAGNLLSHPAKLGYRACKLCARIHWTNNNRKRAKAKRDSK